MKPVLKKVLIIVSIVLVSAILVALSGCTGSSPGGPSPGGASATAVPSDGGVPPITISTGSNAPATTTQSGNTITVSGTKTDADNDQISRDFNLEKGAYIYSWQNSGGADDTFMATIDAADETVSEAISIGDPNGTYCLAVTPGSTTSKPGPARLRVASGGTYTVTITKPAMGEKAPMTISGDKGSQMARAVTLSPGNVTISVKHRNWSADNAGMTIVALNNAATGEPVSLDGDYITGESAEATGSITEPGTYVFSVAFSSDAGGEATIGQ